MINDTIIFLQGSKRSASMSTPHQDGQSKVGEPLNDQDLEDDIDYSISEDELRLQQKVNSVAAINSMRMRSVPKSRMQIPLCRMVYMPMVRPTLDSDLKKLEQEFVHGYREGSWGPLWDQQSEAFNLFAESDPELAHLKNRMFYVCDGNHRLLSWMHYIRCLHSFDIDWHYMVDAIVLGTKGKTSIVLSAMHDINKYNLNHL
jgi:hypothetical protein